MSGPADSDETEGRRAYRTAAESLARSQIAMGSRGYTMKNQRTPEGAEIGQMMARFCDEAEPRARLRMPELPPRCNSCAFRQGPHLANGSSATQMDAIKCVIEGVEFRCHEPAREGAPCSGWAMMMLGKDEPGFGKVPWDFVGGADGK